MCNLEMENKKNTYVLYDRDGKNLSYVVITEEGGKISELLRLRALPMDCKEEFPLFCISGYKRLEPKRNQQEQAETVSFTVKKEHPLYNIFYKLAGSIEKHPFLSIDSFGQGKQRMSAFTTEEKVTILMSKDSSKTKNLTPWIDVVIGHSNQCEFYEEVLEFYQSLGYFSIGEIVEKSIEKVLTYGK